MLIHYQSIVLHNERSKLEATHDSVGISMVHVLVVHNYVVLGSHVVGDVVIDDESEQPVEQGEIDLLVKLLEVALHHHIALSVCCFPHIL